MEILVIHSIYARLTGMPVELDFHRERCWFDWLKRFNDDDLKLVVDYLVKEIKAGKRNVGSLKFSNLIADWQRFEEDLGLARGWLRNRQQPRKPSFSPVVAAPVESNRSRHVSSLVGKLTQQNTFAEGIKALREATK